MSSKRSWYKIVNLITPFDNLLWSTFLQCKLKWTLSGKSLFSHKFSWHKTAILICLHFISFLHKLAIVSGGYNKMGTPNFKFSSRNAQSSYLFKRSVNFLSVVYDATGQKYHMPLKGLLKYKLWLKSNKSKVCLFVIFWRYPFWEIAHGIKY